MSNCLTCGQLTEYNTKYCTACTAASVKGKYAGTSLAAMVRQLYPEWFPTGWTERKQMSITEEELWGGGEIIMICPQCGSEMHPLYFGGSPYDIIWCPKCGHMERLVEDVSSD